MRALRSQQGFYLAANDTAARGRYLPPQGDVLDTHPISPNKCSANSALVTASSQKFISGASRNEILLSVRLRGTEKGSDTSRGLFFSASVVMPTLSSQVTMMPCWSLCSA